ncbi:hypothetical protein L6164_012933 [Bauhinia variegata]|uniref:Uncharacterized protein n=1 Tax=Bauhinia variegata TaxID=167791 RepID=A0ACB9PD54_BAUVA|nr:hypothetical protein L6164_012933 [Bauhinia variegata]
MAERAQHLGQKLIEFIPKESDEKISSGLFAIQEALLRLEPHLDRAEWRREIDGPVATWISNVTKLLDEIEYIIDCYDYYLCDLSAEGELLKIAGMIHRFLGENQNPVSQFSNLFESFSREACNRLGSQIQSNNNENPEIHFIDRNEGWVEPAFDPPNLL